MVPGPLIRNDINVITDYCKHDPPASLTIENEKLELVLATAYICLVARDGRLDGIL